MKRNTIYTIYRGGSSWRIYNNNTYKMTKVSHENANVHKLFTISDKTVSGNHASQRDTVKRLWRMKDRRVKRYYMPGVVRFMYRIESAYANDDGSFTELYGLLKLTIQSKARKWSRQFRLPVDDVESVLWEKAWTIAESYRPSKTRYLLYETIRVSLDNAVRDMLRNRQQQFERSMVTLDEEKHVVDDEETWNDRLTVGQLLTDERLAHDERRLLRYIYETDLSLNQIANEMNVHPSRVYRLLAHVKSILAPLNPSSERV